MKHVVSVSLDEDTIVKIRQLLRERPFRNKSHVVEEAVKTMFSGGEGSE
jgi:Arc/MetJ-type ribon-helix-helix transcriptional regulator